MKNLLIVFFIFLYADSPAQQHTVNIRLGMNAAGLVPDFPSGKDSRIGWSAGMGYKFVFRSKISLGLDLLYDERGFREKVQFYDYSGPSPVISQVIYRYNYEYLSLQIKAGKVFGDKKFAFVNIGLVPSQLRSAIEIYPAVSNSIEQITSDETAIVTKYDIAGLIEIGAGYTFNNRFGLLVMVSYTHSFNTFSNTIYYHRQSLKHHFLTGAMGISYRLGK